MGSFRPGAGNQHLHWYFNFTGCIVETAPESLRLSCGSELTRQGISLPEDRYSYGRRLLGLKFKASIALTSPLNLPAPGRRQPMYLTLRFCIDSVVFAKQLLRADSLRPLARHPFSRSYRVISPSSFDNASSVGLRILSLIHLCRFMVRVLYTQSASFS